MFEAIDVGSTSFILLFALGLITVFYILTDGGKSGNSNKGNSNNDDTPEMKDNGTVEDVPEDLREQPTTQNVDRRQNVGSYTANQNTADQTDDYRPTVSAPLPKIKSVTTTTVYETGNESVENNTYAERPSSELKMEDFQQEEPEVEVICQWCDNVVKMKKGTSIVCPRCSGTIEG